MVVCAIGASTWLVWVLIGIVAGYMSGRLLDNRGIPVGAAIAVGVLAAIGGGYAFIQWFGENNYGQTISLIGAVAITAVVLWCMYFIFGQRQHNDDE